ncbi:MAG: tryptophan synthase subunit alpha [Chloroflexi bacterium]|nr:tryptophan synthase subunit alpha [Chloroflexota bacterium]
MAERAVLHVVSAFLINARGNVLLQQRDEKPELRYPGRWTLFGGTVEDGELPEQAIRRELIEELDLELPLEYWTTYTCPARTTDDTICYNHLYIGRMTRSIESLPLYEGQAMAYFDRVRASRIELAFMQSEWLTRFFEAAWRETQETPDMTFQTRALAGVEAVAAMFQRARAQNRSAFLPFAMIGYPTVSESIDSVARMAELDVDGFEIGVPFSDPLADGPVIQHASQIALENGVTVATGLDAIRQLRARGVRQPMFIFSYLNPLLAYGTQKFAAEMQAVGADGLICPDLPPEEAHLLDDLTRRGLPLIFFLSPNSSEDRIPVVSGVSNGFIYVVSVTGITGARKELPLDLRDYIARIRKHTDLPLVLGFGISTPDQVAQLNGLVDGFIVASALLRAAPDGVDKVVELARVLRGAS